MEVKNSQRKPKKKQHNSKKVDKTGKTLRKKQSGKIIQVSGRRKKPKNQQQQQQQQQQQKVQQSTRQNVTESKLRSYYSHSDYNTSRSQLTTHRESEGGMAIRLAPSTTVEDDVEASKVAENFYFCPSKMGRQPATNVSADDADDNAATIESRTPEARTPRSRTSSGPMRNSNEGRQLRMTQSIPDDDEVNKLVEKYKPRKSIAPVASKPSILTDQMVRSRMSTPMLNEPVPDKTLAVTQNIEFDEFSEMKTAMLGKQRTPPQDTATARLMLERVIEEDTYDSYPKIDEVLQKPPDIVYGLNELPNWMDYLEPTDDDMLNVEPCCSVGSEQIEMYREKKFQLRLPPEKKIILDPWQPSMLIADRDNMFFNPQILFSNTIRSLINVVSSKPERHKSDDDLTQNLSEETIIKHIDLDRTQCYTYVRSDPINSVAKKVIMNPEDIPRREDLLLHPKH